MKPEEMEAGRELDALIHVRVFEMREWHPLIGPHYSTDIADAWKVMEAMIARRQPGTFGTYDPLLGVDGKGEINGKPYVSWWCRMAMGDDDAGALTAPLAICRAALVALDAEAPA